MYFNVAKMAFLRVGGKHGVVYGVYLMVGTSASLSPLSKLHFRHYVVFIYIHGLSGRELRGL